MLGWIERQAGHLVLTLDMYNPSSNKVRSGDQVVTGPVLLPSRGAVKPPLRSVIYVLTIAANLRAVLAMAHFFTVTRSVNEPIAFGYPAYAGISTAR